jgi:hypothetical protein
VPLFASGPHARTRIASLEQRPNLGRRLFHLFIRKRGARTTALAALGLDFLTSLSAAATAIANVGPGLGEMIGRAGNFPSSPDAAKWLLLVCCASDPHDHRLVHELFLRQHGAARAMDEGDDAVDAPGGLVLCGLEVAGGVLGHGDVGVVQAAPNAPKKGA